MRSISMRAACKPLMVAVVGGLSGMVSVGVAQGAAQFTGGNGAIVFGVANYGGPGQANPVYIPNTNAALPDVMESPGHGFLTANLNNTNNVAQFPLAGTVPLPAFAVWTGGTNVNGTFGSGAVGISGPGVAFGLTDANPNATGAASYEIGGWTATFTNNGALNNVNYGNVLGIAGHLDDAGSAVAVALLTHISDTNNVFGAGGKDLNPLILAAAGNPNAQALGGPLGAAPTGNAGIYIAPNGDFVGLAINNIDPVNVPDGDIITVSSTLTVIGDPMHFEPLDYGNMPITLHQINPAWPNSTNASSLFPDMMLVSGNTPEPVSATLLELGALAMLLKRRRKLA